MFGNGRFYCALTIILNIILLPRAERTKLQRACAAFNQSTTTRWSLYYHRSCYVLDTAIWGAWDDWPVKCINLPNGHLAVIQIRDLLHKIKLYLTRFGQAGGISDCKIGLAQTNTTNEPTGNFHWYTRSGVYPVPYEMTLWAVDIPPAAPAIYPLNTGDCVHLSSALGGFYDFVCSASYPLLCQYPDPSPQQQRFKRVAKDASMQPQTVIGEHTIASGHECATKCFQHSLCLSYSVNQATGHCRLHQVMSDFKHRQFTAVMYDQGYQLWDVIIE